jgi:hypothetical protein
VLNPFHGAGDLLTGAATALANTLAGPLARYLLATRGLGDPALAALWRISLAVLAAALVLPVAIWGVSAATGATRRLSGSALRTPLAALATAVLALPATRMEAALANAVSAALLPRPAAPLWLALTVPAGAGRGLAAAAGSLLAALALFAVAVLALARWATLWLLVALAPVAMGFALLPGAGRLTGTWWRLQTTAVFLPVAQAVLLATYLAMFAHSRAGLTGALAGIAMLLLLAKLPGWAAGLALGLEGRDFSGRVRAAALTYRSLPRAGQPW